MTTRCPICRYDDSFVLRRANLTVGLFILNDTVLLSLYPIIGWKNAIDPNYFILSIYGLITFSLFDIFNDHVQKTAFMPILRKGSLIPARLQISAQESSKYHKNTEDLRKWCLEAGRRLLINNTFNAMDEEHLSITFAIDVIITTLLYLILFRGHVFSEYLCIIQNTDTVIGVLIFVVCCRSLLNVFIQRQDRASKSVVRFKTCYFCIVCTVVWYTYTILSVSHYLSHSVSCVSLAHAEIVRYTHRE